MTYVTQVQIYTIFKFSMTHVIEGVFCLFDVAFLLLFAAFFRGVLLDFFLFLARKCISIHTLERTLYGSKVYSFISAFDTIIFILKFT